MTLDELIQKEYDARPKEARAKLPFDKFKESVLKVVDCFRLMGKEGRENFAAQYPVVKPFVDFVNEEEKIR